jgi:hypothetical protein
MHIMRLWAVGALAGTIVFAGAACGSDLPAAPSNAAERFYQAIDSHNGAAACALLAPQTVHEVEQSAQAQCETAILDEDIPAGGAVTELHRYGTEAQARTGNDTAFLAEFGDGWKIVAAACAPRGQMPYDCKVKG